ncbi:hypothetical protein EC988_000366 [Linderina pennispora]|nr:hypothetical protein EC988_000366 [Linderina pennispora]
MDVGTRPESKAANDSASTQSPAPSDRPAQDGNDTPSGNRPADTATDSSNVTVSVPAQNIRQFKEAVVNTSRLLKVFNDQEKELATARAEIAKCRDEAKRQHTAYQNLQRDMESKNRELTKANAETDDARSLLVQRERELSRVRGLKEDLEAKVSELRQSAVSVGAPPKSPNTSLLEEVERLKKDLLAKEGSIKSLKIARDSIRSSTKAEVISIQAKYAREQAELVDRQEKEMTRHRLALAGKEAELELEQERLMQLEMDLTMRTSQLEENAAELKASLDTMTKRYQDAQVEIDELKAAAKAENKARGSEHRSEIAKYTRAMKRDEKRIADLETALAKAKEHAKEHQKQKTRPRPKSTSTAAEAISAAIEDVADMAVEELREEVATLRVDAVHKDETIRKLGVMVEELERKQNPEGGRRPRGKVATLQAEIDQLKADLEVRDQKIEKLETALHITEGTEVSHSEIAAEVSNANISPTDAASTIAQLDLKIIALESDLKTRVQRITELERELKEAQEAANERPMRLRHSSNSKRPAAAGVVSAAAVAVAAPQTATAGRGGSQGARGRKVQAEAKTDNSKHEALYVEIAALRAKVEKLETEKRALQEIVTEQQVKIMHLRDGAGHSVPPAVDDARPALQPTTPRKRAQDVGEEVAQSGTVLAKRPKQVPSISLAKQNGVPAVQKKTANVPSAKQASGTEQTVESIERLLKDKRISSANRAKRFFSILQKTPQKLHASLLQITGEIPEVDPAEFLKSLSSHMASPGAGKVLLAPGSASDSGLPATVAFVVDNQIAGHVPRRLSSFESDVAMAVWIFAYKCDRVQFFGNLMRLLAQRTISSGNDRTVAATCSLARIFAALCFLAQDIQRLRVLLCDLLMEAVDQAHTLPVIANVLSIWPAALKTTGDQTEPSLGLVVRVFQAIVAGIHDLYSEEHSRDEADSLYSVMVDQCGWRQPCKAEFADKIFIEVEDMLRTLGEDSSEYPVVKCAHNLLAPYIVSQ